MDFAPTEMATQTRLLARKFVTDELQPIVAADEKAERFRTEIIAKFGALGLCGVPVPDTYGGAGLGYREYIGVIEEIAKASASYAISVAVTGLVQLVLTRFGSEEQKKKFLPRLASGQSIGAFGLSEPSAGSDPSSMRTTATRDGDTYVANGTKFWITQADVAEIILLMARTGPKSFSAFIIDRGSPGGVVPGLKTGKRERKMGLHISHTMELLLENVRIPASHRIGPEGDGLKCALYALDRGRITVGATALGIGEAALGVAINHARLREQFGQPIGAFQGVSFLLADMRTRLDAARLLVERAAWEVDQNLGVTQSAAMAKLFSTDTAMQLTTDAVQVLGGSGTTEEFPVERYMREAKVLQIVEGTNQIQRWVIGRALVEGEKA